MDRWLASVFFALMFSRWGFEEPFLRSSNTKAFERRRTQELFFEEQNIASPARMSRKPAIATLRQRRLRGAGEATFRSIRCAKKNNPQPFRRKKSQKSSFLNEISFGSIFEGEGRILSKKKLFIFRRIGFF